MPPGLSVTNQLAAAGELVIESKMDGSLFKVVAVEVACHLSEWLQLV